MKQIKLAKNYWAKTLADDYALVDDWNYEELNKYRWGYCGAYAGNSILGLMHTWVLVNSKFAVLKKEKSIIHHINENTLDNQEHNLMYVTYREHLKLHGFQTYDIKYKGISWHKRHKRFTAYVVVNRRQIHLGEFTTEEEAALARSLYITSNQINIK